MRSARTFTVLSLLLTTGLIFCGPTARAQRYEPIDLGPLGTTYSVANGINSYGVVVGKARFPGTGSHAFRYDGTMLDLGTIGGLGTNTSEAFGINDLGWIVGRAGTTGFSHAFVWRPDGTGMTDLGTFGGGTSCANGINGAGWVVGRASYPDLTEHAFLWKPGDQKVTDIGVFDTGSFSNACDVNDDGVVVGIANAYNRMWGGYPDRAFRWDEKGGMVDLGTLGGPASYAYAVNSSGWVAGDSDISSGLAFHAFVYDGRRMRDLGTLDKGTYLYSSAYDVNDAGVVVGYSDMRNGDSHAFIYRPGKDRRIVDLNTLLTTRSGWEINYAYSINDNGWIAAWGRTPDSPALASRAVLLKPVP